MTPTERFGGALVFQQSKPFDQRRQNSTESNGITGDWTPSVFVHYIRVVLLNKEVGWAAGRLPENHHTGNMHRYRPSSLALIFLISKTLRRT